MPNQVYADQLHEFYTQQGIFEGAVYQHIHYHSKGKEPMKFSGMPLLSLAIVWRLPVHRNINPF